MLSKERDVIAPHPKRRHLDANDIEPIEEILAETSCLYLVFKRLVCRGDDSDIDADRIGRADAPDLAVLEHSQELHLERRRHVGDLVEEERSTVCGLEESPLLPERPCEGAANVTEELALEELLWQCRAVLRNETLVLAGAVVVNRPSHKLLAGPGLPLDENRRR